MLHSTGLEDDIRELPPQFSINDGFKLGKKLQAHLISPATKAITFITYRYHDFDPQTGHANVDAGPNSMMRNIIRLASQGKKVIFVTRDPQYDENALEAGKLRTWYENLQKLQNEGGVVRIHKSLHAKIYIIYLENGRTFSSIGSSNLTKQGMTNIGQYWTECNVASWSDSHLTNLNRTVGEIIGNKNCEELDSWKTGAIKKGKLKLNRTQP